MDAPRLNLFTAFRNAQDPEIIQVSDASGQKHWVLINPDTGAWARLSESEHSSYKNDELGNNKVALLQSIGVLPANGGKFVDLSAGWRHPQLTRIIVLLNRSCNLRCAYCFLSAEPTRQRTMLPEVMERVIETGLDREGEHVTFNLHGGEPTLAPHSLEMFLQILEKKRKCSVKKITCAIVTNGTRVTDHFIELARTYDLRVSVSLDGPPEIHDRARPFVSGRGSGAQIVAGIDRLRKSGVTVEGAICTLGKHNVNEIKEISQFFGHLEIPFKARPLTPQGRGKDSALALETGDWYRAFTELFDYHNRGLCRSRTVESYQNHCWTGLRTNACLRTPCGAGNSLIAVDINGDTYPCDGYCGDSEVQMGNVLTSSYDEMGQRPHVLRLRQRSSKNIIPCRDCLYRGMCGPCGYSAKAHCGELSQADPLCPDKKRIWEFLISKWLDMQESVIRT